MDRDHGNCNVIYIDRNVRQDGYVRLTDLPDDHSSAQALWDSQHIDQNVPLLLDLFGEVYLCGTGGACLTQWLNLQDTSVINLKPTIILIDTPFDDRILAGLGSGSRDPSPHSHHGEEIDVNEEEELYGLGLLQRITTESVVRNLAKLVVSIPLIAFPHSSESASCIRGPQCAAEDEGQPTWTTAKLRASSRRMMKRCLELGATDYITSPMNTKCVTNLEVHAYRAHRDAVRDKKALLEVQRGRKRSWVGITEEKPYAYLREAMVSGLMNGICTVDDDEQDLFSSIRLSVSLDRQAAVTRAVGDWYFCAHDFTDDELIVAASVMFQHALCMPALEEWRIPPEQLQCFLLSCRAAYNSFVPYHNFRHVVDVLQATFHFLVQIGILPPLPNAPVSSSAAVAALPDKSPIASLLEPFEALTLLITAIGHDVGHPGVNNGFLVTINAPLAQLYNDRSVLESFHCAAYSQILRRFWPSAFSDRKLRGLLISSLLATDMGLHYDYMKRMGDLQDKLHAENTTVGWNGRMIEEQKSLACALLIKCADISNVARRHDTAVQWMNILSLEFSRQATMEEQLGIPTALASPPKDDLVSMAKAQLSFMNLFAIPLFQGVADLMPGMQYTVDELDVNKDLFEKIVTDEQSKMRQMPRALQRDGTLSPRTMSFAIRSASGDETPSTLRRAPASTEGSSAPGARLYDGAAAASAVATNFRVSPSPNEYKETNGVRASPSSYGPEGGDYSDRFTGTAMQRHSETTEGSSAPYSGDCASHSTSATTGKVPLSPSTQGTSIISRDSMDRPTSVPVTSVTGPESTTTVPDSLSRNSQPELKVDPSLLSSNKDGASREEDDTASQNTAFLGMGFSPNLKAKSSDADIGLVNGSPKALKKRPSRFRINVPFFRKHKSQSPPLQAADTAG